MIYKTKITAICNTYTLLTTLYLDSETKELFLSGDAIFEKEKFKFYPQIATKGTSGDSLRKFMNTFVVQNQKNCEDRIDSFGEIYKTNLTSLTLKYTSLSHLEGVLAGHNTNRHEGLFLENKIPFRNFFPFHGKKVKIKTFENAQTVSNQELKVLYSTTAQSVQSKNLTFEPFKFNAKSYRIEQKSKYEKYATQIGFDKKFCFLTFLIEKRKDETERASHILARKDCANDNVKANIQNGLFLSLVADNWIDTKKLSFDLAHKTILVLSHEKELIKKIKKLSKKEHQKLFAYIEENSDSFFWNTRNALMKRNNTYIELNLKKFN